MTLAGFFANLAVLHIDTDLGLELKRSSQALRQNSFGACFSTAFSLPVLPCINPSSSSN